MNTQLAMMDPMAMASYGLYNAAKKGKGSFEDFLLHYNSFEANKGNNDWLTKMLGKDTLNSLGNSLESLKALNLKGFDSTSFLENKDFLNTKAQAYKLKLKQEMQKRGYDAQKLKAFDAMNNFKNPLLS